MRRRGWLVLAILLVASCNDLTPTRDHGGLDAATGTIGTRCDPAIYFCAGTGVCVVNADTPTCRRQCLGVAYPRCTSDEHETHADLGRGEQCYCLP